MTIFCLCFCLHALPSPTQPPQLVEGAADSSQGASQDDASGINARMKSIIKNLDRNDDEALSRSDVKTSWNRQGESGAAVPSNSISLVLTNTSTRYLIFRDIPLVCCLLAFLMLIFFFFSFLSSFPFFDFDLDIVCFIQSFSCGYAVLSPRFLFLLRLV